MCDWCWLGCADDEGGSAGGKPEGGHVGVLWMNYFSIRNDSYVRLIWSAKMKGWRVERRYIICT